MKSKIVLLLGTIGLWSGLTTANPFLTSDIVPLSSPQPTEYLISIVETTSQVVVPATLTPTGAMLRWDVSTLLPGVNTVKIQARNSGGISAPTTFYVLYSSPDVLDNTGKYRNYAFSPELRIQDTPTMALVGKDVGAVTAAGSFSSTAAGIVIKGDGADIWGIADAFHFVYKPLSSSGTVTVRVATLTNSNAWAKAGVMIRESLSSGSKHALVAVTPNNGVAFQRRLTTNGASSHTSGIAAKVPYWVRLTRIGSSFVAYQSSNGTNWSRIGSATIQMTDPVYVGVAITSHSPGVLATANMDSFTVQ